MADFNVTIRQAGSSDVCRKIKGDADGFMSISQNEARQILAGHSPDKSYFVIIDPGPGEAIEEAALPINLLHHVLKPPSSPSLLQSILSKLGMN